MTVAHYDDSVGHTDQLRHFRRDHNDGFALFYEIDHDLINLVFGSDVDTTGRLIHDQDIRIVCKPSCDNYFLLVATGERLDQRLSARCLDL